MTSIRIPLDAPNIGELEKEYVLRALESGYVSSIGPLVSEFEGRFAGYVGARYAVATVNGTAAIHLALRLLGIGPGDEVIVPALTFIATANPVVYVGATPVVVDVDPLTWNIDPDEVERAVTDRTRAVIPVHLYGNPADMSRLMDIARRHGLYVIEDAAEALGATYNGQHVGTFGDIGIFSFNGNKVITTGGGGMLVTNDPDLAARARLLVNQGRAFGVMEYEHLEIGYNFRLTNTQAALGLAQMERLEQFLATKRRNASLYRELLNKVPGLGWQQELHEGRSSWWLFSILVNPNDFGQDRYALARRLQGAGIQVRPLFLPLSRQPAYAGYGLKTCPVAESLHRRGLNLPSASFLTEEDVRYVCQVLLER
ncbi:perosamine synthetase [Desulfofundulus luciae]|uniref:Perosamine synthetase n=1 Tax=Desulfofundulus luciae TaxID=74702 RepID=A0ABU0AYR2_9FIRM|nr:LegC family aminotransferase [Desulfofundulus luciae]MDQ0285619.1 perosamine synthetase [Desulfofundulus luciae]